MSAAATHAWVTRLIRTTPLVPVWGPFVYYLVPSESGEAHQGKPQKCPAWPRPRMCRACRSAGGAQRLRLSRSLGPAASWSSGKSLIYKSVTNDYQDRWLTNKSGHLVWRLGDGERGAGQR